MYVFSPRSDKKCQEERKNSFSWQKRRSEYIYKRNKIYEKVNTFRKKAYMKNTQISQRTACFCLVIIKMKCKEKKT